MNTTNQTNLPDDKSPIIFVTGTDTDVGKTHFCGLLLDFLLEHGHNSGYQKWVSTGGEVPEDLENCLTSCRKKPAPTDLDLQVPFRFKTPVSPHLAAELDNRPPVKVETIKDCCEKLSASYDILLVEGVGGLLVPLHRELLLADLVAEMHLPILIVARSGLGTINHTLLTLEAARQRGIKILGVIFSDSNEREDEIIVKDNQRTIGEIGKTTIFGRLPWHPDVEEARTAFKPIGDNILAAFKKL